MTPDRTPLLAAGRILLPLAWALALGLPALAAKPASRVPAAADAFQRLAADPWIPRETSLAELGITAPLVLGSPDAQRDIYFPVPAGVPLSGGRLHLNASYLRADPARSTKIISVDGYPVSTRAYTQDKGEADAVVPVSPAPRRDGFVRVGLAWRTAMSAEARCDDARAVGNVLRVETDTRLSYRFDARALRDIGTAWRALPASPVVLVSGAKLAPAAYETAWRTGLALERTGRRVRFARLPAAGDEVDLGDSPVPAELSRIPAFAALADGGRLRLANKAQVGAFIALGQNGPLRADLVIADPPLVAALHAALDALRDEVQAKEPEAAEAFAAWRAQALDPFAKPLAARELRLARFAGRPAIVVAEDAGTGAAGLFSREWVRLATSSSHLVAAAASPPLDGETVSLAHLGGQPGSFDVLSHGDWTATFNLADASVDGRTPRRLVVDLAAAPSAGRTRPVASVYMNEVLLGAKQLDAGGERERIAAAIPPYALAGRNTVRVAFVRQLSGDQCRETPEPYPVAVLPSSHLVIEEVKRTNDFNGMALRYAAGAQVLAPAAWLADAPATLPFAVRLAASVGVSPVKSQFAADGSAPAGPFLALDVPVASAQPRFRPEAARLAATTADSKALLDLDGFSQAGILEVVKSGEHLGIAYRTLGAPAPRLDAPMHLARGDVALVHEGRVAAEFRADDPAGRASPDGAAQSWLDAFGFWWVAPVAAIVFMIALLVAASRYRRRQRAERASA